MSKLSVNITRSDVNQKGNHFIVIQLDEVEYPSGLKKVQKFRTEIEVDTDYPQFLKNFFEFQIHSIANRVVLRIGLFKFNDPNNQSYQNNIINNYNNLPSGLLFENSELIGAGEILFTSSLIEMIRKHKWVENDLQLNHPEKNKSETGHVYLRLSLTALTLETKVYEDNKEIESIFYDPFETEPEIIREKLHRTIILNEEKQMKLGKTANKLELIRNKMKTLANDKLQVTNEIQKIEEENNLLRKNLDKIQNYDEIHIEVDLLSQSSQGVQMIEKKYAVLLSQFSLQTEHKYELETSYEEIDPLLSKIKIVKDEIQNVKSANEQLKFNITRQEDMLPLITNYAETIRNNEKLVQNLKENIKQVSNKNESDIKKVNPSFNNEKDIDERIKYLYEERKKLEEKKDQMNLYSKLYGDEEEEIEVQYNKFFQIAGSGYDPMMNKLVKESESEIISKYKEQIEALNEEVKQLSDKLERINKKEKESKENHILIDPNIKFKKQEMMMKIQNVEKREQAVLEELNSSEDYCRYSINKLRQRLQELDFILEKQVRLANRNNYQDY